MLYLSMAILLLVLSLTAWARHAAVHPRTWAWPTHVLRMIVFLYVDVFYVGVLNAFFTGMDCQWGVMVLKLRDFESVGECRRTNTNYEFSHQLR